jgi:hypothetical protein
VTDAPAPDPAETPALSPEDEGRGRLERYVDWAKKLSARTAALAALGLVIVGVLMGFIVAAFSEPPYGIRLMGLLSEALVSTGLSAAILLFALYNRVEIDGAVTNAFKETCVPVISESITKSTSSMEAHVTREYNRAIASVDARATDAEDAIEERMAKAFAGTAPPVKILKQDEIYLGSIDLLRKLDGNGGGDIRILMSAEEDLSQEPPNGNGGKQEAPNTGADGEQWLNELKKWLGPRNLGRSLRRVIAIPRKGFGEQLGRAQKHLLKPFEHQRATQWFLPDEDFSISVLLLGEQYALFGFPEQPRESDSVAYETPFQYAAVIKHPGLVRYLNHWFDERFADHCEATEVMHDGNINKPALKGFDNLEGAA